MSFVLLNKLLLHKIALSLSLDGILSFEKIENFSLNKLATIPTEIKGLHWNLYAVIAFPYVASLNKLFFLNCLQLNMNIKIISWKVYQLLIAE